ncbi:MAG TPA: MBL fold metallo-hydrolase [archaeon]|nr:MBL fold metallo-hydrolase [archaeon]
MSKIIHITSLVENTVTSSGLLAESGLAFWIETGSLSVLFDTGQGAVLLANATHLGLGLEKAGAIVLSHGHYDHTGGLSIALKKSPRAKIYAHPEAFQEKYVREPDGPVRSIGISSFNKHKLTESENEQVLSKAVTEIGSGLFVTGEIPRTTEFEDTGGPFFTDRACLKPDPLTDDQALFFQSDRGTVVLLGCAHAGVINTLRYIRQITGGKPLHAVAGGMHLVKASEKRIERTIENIKELEIERLYPVHCTGISATARIWCSLPGKCFACPVGTKIEFMPG